MQIISESTQQHYAVFVVLLIDTVDLGDSPIERLLEVNKHIFFYIFSNMDR